MLASSDYSIRDAIASFASAGLEAGYLVPTSTGLGKSILDAHWSFRSYLKSHKIHDFSEQEKGPRAKVTLPIGIIGKEGISKSTLSLYRPETKNGDPRIWIRDLRRVVKPSNLIAIFKVNNDLYAVNVSDPDVWSGRSNPATALGSLLKSTTPSLDNVAYELLEKVRNISEMGFIKSLRKGDTGVGYTLETMLEIKANSSKAPDYKGIEIKAGRITKNQRTKLVTLLSKAPDWSASEIKNGTDLLKNYGYTNKEKGRLELYCTVRNEPNPQGLALECEIDSKNAGFLRANHISETCKSRVIAWYLESLKDALAKKHQSTFWISAETKMGTDGNEMFKYTEILHTRDPLVSNIGTLVETGSLSLDLTLSMKDSGKARDHGYLFRIHKRDMELLFPICVTYSL